MKIAILITTLDAGGAERVAATLAGTWAGDGPAGGHQVHLLTYSGPEAVPAYRLPTSVDYRPLDLLRNSLSVKGIVHGNIARVTAVARWLRIESPDILICFMTETNVVGTVAAKLAGIPVVISERTDPAQHWIPRFHRLARHLVYPRADSLTVQSDTVADWYKTHMGLSATVVPNPIDTSVFAPASGSTPLSESHRQIIAVGRLDAGKAFDVLIDAFSNLSQACADWTLTIYGEGPERAALERLIAERDVADRVFLPGTSDRIADELRASDVFVSASRYEGFPNAVTEALASGLCVISSRVSGVIENLLDSGRRGVLVPIDDAGALRAAMERVIQDDSLRMTYRQLAPDGVKPYEVSRVASRWLELFETLVSRRRGPFATPLPPDHDAVGR